MSCVKNTDIRTKFVYRGKNTYKWYEKFFDGAQAIYNKDDNSVTMHKADGTQVNLHVGDYCVILNSDNSIFEVLNKEEFESNYLMIPSTIKDS